MEATVLEGTGPADIQTHRWTDQGAESWISKATG